MPVDNKLKRLRLHQMERRVARWRTLAKQQPPNSGWIRAIRKTLGMTTTQLGRRMNVSQQAVANLEQREISGNATIGSLEKAARAMGCELVYAIVPSERLAEILRKQAVKRAGEQANTIAHTMHLEAQDVPAERQKRLRAEAASDLWRLWPRSLWD
jgi:predicted DNA-binding mobile mystery protein A